MRASQEGKGRDEDNPNLSGGMQGLAASSSSVDDYDGISSNHNEQHEDENSDYFDQSESVHTDSISLFNPSEHSSKPGSTLDVWSVHSGKQSSHSSSHARDVYADIGNPANDEFDVSETMARESNSDEDSTKNNSQEKAGPSRDSTTLFCATSYSDSPRWVKGSIWTAVVLLIVCIILVSVSVTITSNNDSSSEDKNIDDHRPSPITPFPSPPTSHLRTGAPTEAPVMHPTPICNDSLSTFVVNGEPRDCDWLSNRTAFQLILCKPSYDAYHLCPNTCNSCNEAFQPSPAPSSYLQTLSRTEASTIEIVPICEDLSGTMMVNGSPRDCEWLSAGNRSMYRVILCQPSFEAYELCPKTCERCNNAP